MIQINNEPTPIQTDHTPTLNLSKRISKELKAGISTMLESVTSPIKNVFNVARDRLSSNNPKNVVNEFNIQEVRNSQSDVQHKSGSLSRSGEIELRKVDVILTEEQQLQVNNNELNILQNNFNLYGKHFKEEVSEFHAVIENKLDQLRELINVHNRPDQQNKIAHLKEELHGHIEAMKADTISRTNFAKLRHGKAKQVWRKAVSYGKNVVYYTPRKTTLDFIYSSKKAEIQEEVKTCQSIDRALANSALSGLLSKGGCSKKEAAVLSKKLLQHYGTKEEIKRSVNKVHDTATSLASELNIKPKHAKMIKDAFQDSAEVRKFLECGQHLATEMREVEDKINGMYTVETPRAMHDLEHEIKNFADDKYKNLGFSEREELGLHLVKGLRDLHQTGRVHGDLKPDNALIYEEDGAKSLRLSDFGKTRTLGSDETAMHTGNPRFAAPEGRLSHKAEVYSAGLLLIRMFEAEVLGNNNSLMTVVGDSSRQGVERFVILNDKCLQSEVQGLRAKVSLVKKNISLATTGKVPSEQLRAAESEIHKYIDALVYGLKAKHPDVNPGKFDSIGEMLKLMTDKDPSKRPTMDEVVEMYSDAMRK